MASLSFFFVAVSSVVATAIVPVTEDSGFWFGNFTVGNSTNLNLLVDTGSGDIIINPGLYKPGPSAQNLHQDFNNSYGTTQSNGGGSIDIIGPLYSDLVTVGNMSAEQPVGDAQNETGIPHDGIIGFAPSSVQFPGRSTTAFVDRLCQNGDLSECRFGLALTNDRTGSLVLGELDSSLYENNLTTVSLIETWVVNADIYLNGASLTADVPVLMDSGTATIVGPIHQVAGIFNATGITGVMNGSTLFGYFPCDQPTTLGIGLPSKTEASAAAKNQSAVVSKTSTVFNISSDQWAIANNGNNNCTALLSGQDLGEEAAGLWIFGQAFFTGLYVDHNLKDSVMGFAKLSTQASTPPLTWNSTTNTTTATPSSTSSSATSTTTTSAGIAAATINWTFSVYAVVAVLMGLVKGC